MTTDAIPQPNRSGATGPRTEAGKAIASRNSTKHGLFARRDFILEGEDEEYAQTFSELMAELSPGGVLEQTFATEIMGANWRLRRCGVLEFELARSTDPGPDAQDAIQKSIDRVRAQSHNILRRSLAELRKLQTERHARILMTPDGEAPTGLGLTDSRQAVRIAARSIDTPKAQQSPHAAPNVVGTNPSGRDADVRAAIGAAIEEQWRRNEEEFNALLEGSSFCKPAPAAEDPAASSFCNPPETPRNALCPCGSGAKYKRCCGRNAPPVLNGGSPANRLSAQAAERGAKQLRNSSPAAARSESVVREIPGSTPGIVGSTHGIVAPKPASRPDID